MSSPPRMSSWPHPSQKNKPVACGQITASPPPTNTCAALQALGATRLPCWPFSSGTAGKEVEIVREGGEEKGTEVPPETVINNNRPY